MLKLTKKADYGLIAMRHPAEHAHLAAGRADELTKKADYGLIAMRHLAEHADLGACSAKDLAEMYAMPQEALAKILQRLTKAGLLVSQYGTNGGYTLARN